MDEPLVIRVYEDYKKIQEEGADSTQVVASIAAQLKSFHEKRQGEIAFLIKQKSVIALIIVVVDVIMSAATLLGDWDKTEPLEVGLMALRLVTMQLATVFAVKAIDRLFYRSNIDSLSDKNSVLDTDLYPSIIEKPDSAGKKELQFGEVPDLAVSLLAANSVDVSADAASGGTDAASGGTDAASGGTDAASAGTDAASAGTDAASAGTDAAAGGVEDGFLNTVSIANLRAIETFIGFLRGFAGAERYRSLEETDADAIIMDMIVPELMKGRTIKPSVKSLVTEQCSDSCDERTDSIKAKILSGREPTKAEVDEAWELCPNAMAELCGSPELPASANCQLQCSESAWRADKMVFELRDFTVNKSELERKNWVLMTDLKSEQECFDEFLQKVSEAEGKSTMEAAFWVLEPDGGGVGKAYWFDFVAPTGAASRFEKMIGATGALLLRGAGMGTGMGHVKLPDSDPGLLGETIADAVNSLYGGFSITDRTDEIYHLIKERDSAFETYKDWYREALMSVSNNLSAPSEGGEQELILDLGEGVQKLKEMPTSSFHEHFTVGLTKMLASVQIRKERDDLADTRRLDVIQKKYTAYSSVLWTASALAASVLMYVTTQKVAFAARTWGTFLELFRDAFPAWVVSLSVALLVALSISFIISRNLQRMMHNHDMRIENTDTLRKTLCSFTEFVFGLSGTPHVTENNFKTYKEHLHYNTSTFPKPFPDPGANMYDLLTEGQRNKLFQFSKDTVQQFDRCNTAKKGATVPFPASDLAIYAVVTAFLLVAMRYLYVGTGVRDTLSKLTDVRNLMPAAKVDFVHKGAASALRGLVMCEDQGIRHAFDVFKWGAAAASVLVVILFSATLTNSGEQFKDTLDFIRLKSRCIY